MYHPFIFKLDSTNSDILDKKGNNVILSSTINLSQISLGFHYFLNRTKSAINITKNLETKNEFYNVVNPFEYQIPNYEDTINNLTKDYLKLKDTPNNNTFYKLWEMLFIFNLSEKKDISYASISDTPSPFIEAFINFREKLQNGISKDKIFSISIHPEQKDKDFNEQFLGYYLNTYPELINIHKTYTSKEADKYKTKDNGDITQLKTIKLFKKDIDKSKNYADLVTADGELIWDNELYQEQEAYQLLLGEIIATLKVQNNNGNAIIKIFDCFTIPTIKLIYLVSSFYQDVFIYKPLFSRPIYSERYLILKGFKYDQKKDSALLDTKIKSLEKVLEDMNTNKYVFDIYPDLEIPQDYLDKFRYINIKITNPQQIMINEIVKYIKENNYFGEKYHLFREQQINATKWWLNTFFPPSNNIFIKNKEEINKLINNLLEKNKIEQSNFSKTLIH